jgi:nicotinamidase-related amidase
MPLSQIDPVAALVVIDLQKGIVNRPNLNSVGVVARAARLTRAFRARRLPVVLVRVTDRAPGRTDAQLAFSPSPDWADLVPELDAQPADHIVTKMTWGAFYGTSLDLFLRRQGVTQVFLAGISTSAGVESTARSAHERGYHVVLVVDAMTDLNPEAHRHSVEHVFPRLGETTTTDEVEVRLRGDEG